MGSAVAVLLVAALGLGCPGTSTPAGGGGGGPTLMVHTPDYTREVGQAFVTVASAHQALIVGNAEGARGLLDQGMKQLQRARQRARVDEQRQILRLEDRGLQLAGLIDRHSPDALAASRDLLDAFERNQREVMAAPMSAERIATAHQGGGAGPGKSAVSYGAKTAAKASAETNNKSAAKTGVQPATKTGVQPATETAVKPTTKTDVQLATETNNKSANKTGIQPATKTGIQPTTKTGVQPATKTGAKPQTKVAAKPISKAVAKPKTVAKSTTQPKVAAKPKTQPKVAAKPKTQPKVAAKPKTQPKVAAKPKTRTAARIAAAWPIRPQPARKGGPDPNLARVGLAKAVVGAIHAEQALLRGRMDAALGHVKALRVSLKQARSKGTPWQRRALSRLDTQANQLQFQLARGNPAAFANASKLVDASIKVQQSFKQASKGTHVAAKPGGGGGKPIKKPARKPTKPKPKPVVKRRPAPPPLPELPPVPADPTMDEDHPGALPRG